MAGYALPEGTTVTTQAFTQHRSSDIFPDPLAFRPDRWENPTQEMKDMFMPFGGGTRGILKLGLAVLG